jgi:hypothetical protein
MVAPVLLDRAGYGRLRPVPAGPEFVAVRERVPDGVSRSWSTPSGANWSLQLSVQNVGDKAGTTTGEEAGKSAFQKASLGQFVEAGGLRLRQSLQLSNISGDHGRFTSFRVSRSADGDLVER